MSVQFGKTGGAEKNGLESGENRFDGTFAAFRSVLTLTYIIDPGYALDQITRPRKL